VDDALPASQRRALGTFLRARRDRLTPAEVGLAAGRRRRAPGLRREELAQLCGISPTWYTWIEQGRDVSVSGAALGRLGDALRLTRAERRYLFALAGKHDPRGGRMPDDAPVPAALGATVNAVGFPAYVLDRRWNVVAHNAAARGLFAGWLDSAEGRNLLVGFFLDPAVRALIPDWEERAQRLVAEFRAECGPDVEEPRTAALVAELRRGSAAFAQAWDAQVVVEREGRARTFLDQNRKVCHYEQVALHTTQRPDLKLVVLVPLDPGKE
jgi:transcriptional regulator with XRE-family HTH domain